MECPTQYLDSALKRQTAASASTWGVCSAIVLSYFVKHYY